jgi:vacuolar protein-sorting-associated protein 4
MQGVGSGNQNLLVLAATNFPWGLDSAIRRRFERRIYIPLPEAPARTAMFKIHVGNTPHHITDKEFEDLGRRTNGYSGSDINVLVRNALMEPIRIIQMATHFKKIRGENPANPGIIVDDLYTPCSPGDPQGQAMTLSSIEPSKLVACPVSYQHMLKAINTIRPSVSEADIEQHIQFTRDFGQES